MFSAGKDKLVLKGAYKDKKVLSNSKKTFVNEKKKMLRNAVSQSVTDDEGILICWGAMSCLESIDVKKNLLYVSFKQDMDVVRYNQAEFKPVSQTSKVVAPLAGGCKWTFSWAGTPDMYYNKEYSLDSIKKDMVKVHYDNSVGDSHEMGLRIFMKDGTVVRVDAGSP